VDANGDHKADRVVVIAKGLDQPNGVAMRNGALYVATASRLLRFDDMLYMSVGAPCNVCASPPMMSTIVRMKPDGSGLIRVSYSR
jgi:hypothetical protein